MALPLRPDDRDGEPWVAALYHGDDGDERWDDADSLAAELREGTAAFAATSRDEDSDDPAGWFDWDGSPW